MTEPLTLSEAFDILDLPYGASDHEVARQYKTLALKHHPDKSGGSADKFHQIKSARDFILNTLDIIHDDATEEADFFDFNFEMDPSLQTLDNGTIEEWYMVDAGDDENLIIETPDDHAYTVEDENAIDAKAFEDWHKEILTVTPNETFDESDIAETFDEIYDKAVKSSPIESLGVIVPPLISPLNSELIAATREWRDCWTTNIVLLEDLITEEQIAAGSTHIIVQHGSITHVQADCIVSSVSHSLLQMPGIDTAIRTAGGPVITEQLNIYASIATATNVRPKSGNVYLTDGGQLPSAYVIHCVVDNSLIDLRTCYLNALTLAKQCGFRTIAFCGLAMGRGGMICKAAKTAAKTIATWIEANPGDMDVIALIGYQEHEWRTIDACARHYLTIL